MDKALKTSVKVKNSQSCKVTYDWSHVISISLNKAY